MNAPTPETILQVAQSSIDDLFNSGKIGAGTMRSVSNAIEIARQLDLELQRIRYAAEQITDEGDYGFPCDKDGNTLVDVDLIMDLHKALFPKKYEDPVSFPTTPLPEGKK